MWQDHHHNCCCYHYEFFLCPSFFSDLMELNFKKKKKDRRMENDERLNWKWKPEHPPSQISVKKSVCGGYELDFNPAFHWTDHVWLHAPWNKVSADCFNQTSSLSCIILFKLHFKWWLVFWRWVQRVVSGPLAPPSVGGSYKAPCFRDL